jgi:hypothetical protein
MWTKENIGVSSFGAMSVSFAGSIVGQGEKTVGSGTVQLTATSTPCSRVWIGAPTARHTKAGTNTTPVLVGGSSTSNASGGIPLATDNAAGFWLPVSDASAVYLTGFTAGDAVEYLIVG